MKLNDMLAGDSHITLMIGLPGSGKSTYVDRHKTANTVAISRDSIRAELGFCKEGDKCVLDKEKEDVVTKRFNHLLIKAVADGKDIYLDNMHTRRKYRDNVKELLKQNFPKTNFIYHYVYCETSLENCMKRRPMIPEEVYRKMIRSIDWPTADEYNTFEVVKS